MKTIEEAASEHAIKRHYDLNLRKFVVGDFKAGVEFAQQWISCNEDYPPVNEPVLCKDSEDDDCPYTVMYWNGSYWVNPCVADFGYMTAPEPIHWRLIELE